MTWKVLKLGLEGCGSGRLEENGDCWGSRDPPESLSMSCLERLNAIDITVVILEGSCFIGHPILSQACLASHPFPSLYEKPSA